MDSSFNRENRFYSSMTPAKARRQLRISLMVVGALAIGTVLAFLTSQIKPVHTKQDVVKQTTQLPFTQFIRHAIVTRTVKPNG